MGIIDLAILAVLVFAGVGGLRKGLIRQVAALAGLLFGIWGAIHFSEFTANFLTQKFALTTQYLSLIAFAVTFLVILVGIHFLGILVEGVFKMAALGMVNKIFGAFVSIIKTVLILSVIFLLIGKINHNLRILPDDFGEKSLLYKPIEKLAPRLFPYLHFDEIKDSIGKAVKSEP
ncbi:MAG TPA: CvpA family protein [Tenuifilaceae bacterium]|nr:CvpA family protein [Tenuifilaceae bacterium]